MQHRNFVSLPALASLRQRKTSELPGYQQNRSVQARPQDRFAHSARQEGRHYRLRRRAIDSALFFVAGDRHGFPFLVRAPHLRGVAGLADSIFSWSVATAA
jgi:hypothetical protein